MSETTETQPRQGAHRVEVTLKHGLVGASIKGDLVRQAEGFARYAMTQHTLRFSDDDGELLVTIGGFTRMELSEFLEEARAALIVRSDGDVRRDHLPDVVYAET